MDAVLPDPATPFGACVAQRLREDAVIWLTTVAANGTPQPNPVWFLWDGHSVLGPVRKVPTASPRWRQSVQDGDDGPHRRVVGLVCYRNKMVR